MIQGDPPEAPQHGALRRPGHWRPDHACSPISTNALITPALSHPTALTRVGAHVLGREKAREPTTHCRTWHVSKV